MKDEVTRNPGPENRSAAPTRSNSRVEVERLQAGCSKCLALRKVMAAKVVSTLKVLLPKEKKDG